MGTLGLCAVLACACSNGSSSTGTDVTTGSGGGGSGGGGSGGGASSDGCTGTIVIGRYKTDQCVAGEEVGTVTIDLSKSCDFWTRPGMNGGTKDDSFTRFACYGDRFCFTLHPDSATCAPGTQDGDVELLAGVCQKDKPLPNGTSINA
jgi:hypothetical protein